MSHNNLGQLLNGVPLKVMTIFHSLSGNLNVDIHTFVSVDHMLF